MDEHYEIEIRVRRNMGEPWTFRSTIALSEMSGYARAEEYWHEYFMRAGTEVLKAAVDKLVAGKLPRDLAASTLGPGKQEV